MSKEINRSRTKDARRDRRNAGAFRREAKAIRRGRDLERRAARRLKQQTGGGRGGVLELACDGVGSVGSTGVPFGNVTTQLRPGSAPGHLAAKITSQISIVGIRAAAGGALMRDGWLPEAGRTVVVGGVRIEAVPVDATPGHPFYVLDGVDLSEREG